MISDAVYRYRATDSGSGIKNSVEYWVLSSKQIQILVFRNSFTFICYNIYNCYRKCNTKYFFTFVQNHMKHMKGKMYPWKVVSTFVWYNTV
jgi:hypothetical protein